MLEKILEYYKELFFTKKKHSYDLHSINFYAEDENDIVKYNNVPAVGFKFLDQSGSMLDPVSGYLFHPYNSADFKNTLVLRNILKNGVCLEPIIFEYIKDGSFRAHLYSDIQDELMEVKVHDKVSLSESNPGTILRSIEDESYYLYMGLVGQFYVNENGDGSVKKKHLVLKTDCFADDDDTILIGRHFTFVDFNKDKVKDYFKIKDIPANKLKIKYYSAGDEAIYLGEYIRDNIFDVYDFQRDYPSFILSSTVRFLFSKNDISMTRNVVKLDYEYLGETNLTVNYDIKYTSFDSKAKIFYNASVVPTLIGDDGIDIDVAKHNYVVEIGNEKFLISHRRLVEIDTYNVSAKRDFSLFQRYSYSTEISLFSIVGSSIISRTRFFNHKRFSKNSISPEVWLNKVKVYKVEYLLNDKHHFNMFSNLFESSERDDLFVNDREVFNLIKQHGKIAVCLFGDGT